MAALQRAVALAEVHDVAVLVREQLQFDVLRILEVTLCIHRAVAEICERFAPRGLEGGRDLVARAGDLETLTAAAARRLERERKPVGVCGAQRIRGIGEFVRRAGNDGHARLGHRASCADLIAHRVDRIRVRTDPHESRARDRACERRVLGEEAVPRMHGVRVRAMRDVEQAIDREITLRGRRGADAVRVVRVAHVRRVAVGVGIHGDRRDSHLACRAHHA